MAILLTASMLEVVLRMRMLKTPAFILSIKYVQEKSCSTSAELFLTSELQLSHCCLLNPTSGLKKARRRTMRDLPQLSEHQFVCHGLDKCERRLYRGYPNGRWPEMSSIFCIIAC